METAGLDAFLSDRSHRELFSGVWCESPEGEMSSSPRDTDTPVTWGIPNRLDIRFDTASVTELFTTVVAFQVVEEGGLSLETRAVGHLGLEGTSIHPEASRWTWSSREVPATSSATTPTPGPAC